MSKLTLVVYFVSECSSEEIINFEFFINHGVYCDLNREYIFVFTPHTKDLKSYLPEYSNIHILYSDFLTVKPGWLKGIKFFDSIEQFDTFVFLDNTLRGPFLPNYVNKRNWFSLFSSLLNYRTKIAGIIIDDTENVYLKQNMFVTNLEGLKDILNNNLFIQDEKETLYTISQYFLSIHTKLECICPSFYNRDWSIDKPINRERMGNPFLHSSLSIKPLDVIFFPSQYEKYQSKLQKYTLLQDNEMKNISIENPFTSYVRPCIEFLNEKNVNLKSHYSFFVWLMNQMNVKIIVNLNNSENQDDDSVLAFSCIDKGEVFNINNFETIDLEEVKEKTFRFFSQFNRINNNVTLVKANIELLSETFQKKIDILHFSGFTNYESIKSTFSKWENLLSNNSILLITGTILYQEVGRFFNEINTESFYKDHYLIGGGIGFATKNLELAENIRNNWTSNFILTKNPSKNNKEMFYQYKYDIWIDL